MVAALKTLACLHLEGFLGGKRILDHRSFFYLKKKTWGLYEFGSRALGVDKRFEYDTRSKHTWSTSGKLTMRRRRKGYWLLPNAPYSSLAMECRAMIYGLFGQAYSPWRKTKLRISLKMGGARFIESISRFGSFSALNLNDTITANLAQYAWTDRKKKLRK